MVKQEIKIFVGSPGDVTKERSVVFDLIERLNGDPSFEKYFELAAVGWDRNPYLSNTWVSPQKAIADGLTRPSQCDFAVFIFWSRIGTPLAAGDFPNADLADIGFEGTPLTGTTWEFYDALAGEKTAPHCETFKCESSYPPASTAGDMSKAAEQLKGVEALFSGFKARGSYKRSYTTYNDIQEFSRSVEDKLRLFLEAKKPASGLLDTGSLHVEHPRPRELRRKQLDWLAALLGKLQQRPQAKDCLDNCSGLAVPLVVAGQEIEWHKALARQLKALLNHYDASMADPAVLPGWHDNRKLRLRKLHLVNELRANLDLAKLSNDEVRQDSDFLQGIAQALLERGNEVFHCVSIADRWSDDEEELIRWWLEFWRSVKLLTEDQKICALLSIEVSEPSGLLKRLRGKSSEAKAITTLSKLSAEPDLTPYILERLSSPTKTCWREWCESQLVHVKDIDSFRDDLERASEAVFQEHESIPHKRFKDALTEQLKPHS